MSDKRWMAVAAVLFLVAAILAGEAYPRYNGVRFGALPLAAAFAAIAAAALSAPGTRRRIIALISVVLAVAIVGIWLRPSLAGAVREAPTISRAHVLLTLPLS